MAKKTKILASQLERIITQVVRLEKIETGNGLAALESAIKESSFRDSLRAFQKTVD